MDTKVQALLESIKKPKMTFDLLPSAQQPSVSIDSHVGGKPFIGAQKHAPVCHMCKHPMTFVFQLRIPYSDTESVLHTFHYCFGCAPKKGNKGFGVQSYRNPRISEAQETTETPNSIQFSRLECELYWSLPDWESLTILYPDVAGYFLRSNEEEFDIEYDAAKESFLDGWSFDAFSFVGGYPNFLHEPVFPHCDCCNRAMKHWVQIDSYDELGFHWENHGVLHIFRCDKGNDNYKIIVQ